MLLLGRAMFVIGFAGLAFQIMEEWIGLTGLKIGHDNMVMGVLWWAVFGGIAAGGVLIMNKHKKPDAE